MISRAIIPAAGLATRFLPASKAIPKEMFPLYDRPVIQYIVEEAVAAGMKDIVFVTAEGKEAIADHFDRLNPKFCASVLPEKLCRELHSLEETASVISVRQKNPRGLGHAVLTGLAAIPAGPFAVLLPDMFLFSKNNESCMNRMTDLYRQHDGASVIALMRVPDEDRCRYGMAEGVQKNDSTFEIRRLKEKPGIDGTDSNLAIVGRYLFSAGLRPLLETAVPGEKNEIQLTDAVDLLAQKEPLIGLVLEPSDLVFDAGDKKGYALANAFLAARKIPNFIDTLRGIVD